MAGILEAAGGRKSVKGEEGGENKHNNDIVGDVSAQSISKTIEPRNQALQMR